MSSPSVFELEARQIFSSNSIKSERDLWSLQSKVLQTLENQAKLFLATISWLSFVSHHVPSEPQIDQSAC